MKEEMKSSRETDTLKGREVLMTNLRMARIQNGLTQADLARMAGVDVSMISKYEKCKSTPQRNTLERIAKVLNCSVDWLIGNRFDLGELQAAAMPLVEFLRKKGHPHMTAIVTGRSVLVNEDVIGVPLDYDD